MSIETMKLALDYVERHAIIDGIHVRDALRQAIEQAEQAQPVAWRNAALRIGEDLCSVGPFGYYDMTAEQWLDWALSVVTVHAPPPRQPEQAKPVKDQTEVAFEAWWQSHGQFCRAGGGDYEKTFAYHAWMACLEIPEQAQPVAWIVDTGSGESLEWHSDVKADLVFGTAVQPLYTAPPPRHPLTDVEIELLWDNTLSEDVGITALRKIARAIEAAHGIKGQT